MLQNENNHRSRTHQSWSFDEIASQNLCRFLSEANGLGFVRKKHTVETFLKEDRADPNYVWEGTGNRPLHFIAKYGGSPKLARVLIDYGANINASNDSGELFYPDMSSLYF
jgi:ankyrin repeat protein